MKFLIIAVDHGWQMVRHVLPLNQWPLEETQLQAAITDAINSLQIDLVCEESNPCGLSIAQRLAYEHTPRISWKNINMTAQERIEAGIYEALLNRPTDLIETETDGLVQVEHRVKEDAVREQFFCKEIVKAVDANNSRSGLVLCGDMHAEFLKELLEKEGYATKTNHALISTKSWK